LSFPLLPLREKVSAKLTDEGLIILTTRAQPTAAAATLLFDPSPDPLRGHPLPQGERGTPALELGAHFPHPHRTNLSCVVHVRDCARGPGL